MTSWPRCMGCGRDEIAIVENATRAWDMAFYALPFAPGDRILCARAEYESNVIAFLQVAGAPGRSSSRPQRRARPAVGRGAARDGRRARQARSRSPTCPTNGGLVNPAAEVGAVAREAGIPYLLDACQSVGQLPIDVGAHRLRHALRHRAQVPARAARDRLPLRPPRPGERLEPPLLDLHAAEWVAADRYEIRPDARRFENWEFNVAGKLGLGAAVALRARLGHRGDRGARRRRSPSACAAALRRDRRRARPRPGARRCGIVSFTVDGPRVGDVKRAPGAQRAINVVGLAARTTRARTWSSAGWTSSVRASVHYYNTEDEVDALARRSRLGASSITEGRGLRRRRSGWAGCSGRCLRQATTQAGRRRRRLEHR